MAKKKNKHRRQRVRLPFFVVVIVIALSFLYKGINPLEYAQEYIREAATTFKESSSSPIAREFKAEADLPIFAGKPYVVLNNNIPDFSQDEEKLNDPPFEYYSPLDGLGRCGYACAKIGKELMPTEKRESIGSVKPSGWQISKYDFVDGKYLYNRCHLIGFQLAGENANERNLITGTRYLNVDGMLPFENTVADYIDNTNNHVMYRVTPIFIGDELIPRGVQMEGYSVEDGGQ